MGFRKLKTEYEQSARAGPEVELWYVLHYLIIVRVNARIYC